MYWQGMCTIQHTHTHTQPVPRTGPKRGSWPAGNAARRPKQHTATPVDNTEIIHYCGASEKKRALCIPAFERGVCLSCQANHCEIAMPAPAPGNFKSGGHTEIKKLMRSATTTIYNQTLITATQNLLLNGSTFGRACFRHYRTKRLVNIPGGRRANLCEVVAQLS